MIKHLVLSVFFLFCLVASASQIFYGNKVYVHNGCDNDIYIYLPTSPYASENINYNKIVIHSGDKVFAFSYKMSDPDMTVYDFFKYRYNAGYKNYQIIFEMNNVKKVLNERNILGIMRLISTAKENRGFSEYVISYMDICKVKNNEELANPAKN